MIQKAHFYELRVKDFGSSTNVHKTCFANQVFIVNQHLASRGEARRGETKRDEALPHAA
jgi:hypothetical protein